MVLSLLAAVAWSAAYVAVALWKKEPRLGFALPWAALGGIPAGATVGAAAAGLVGVGLASSPSCRTEVCSAALAVLAMLGGAVGAVVGAIGCAWLAYGWDRKNERQRSTVLAVASGALGVPALWAAFHLLSRLEAFRGAP